jgi:hypothetical protein
VLRPRTGAERHERVLPEGVQRCLVLGAAQRHGIAPVPDEVLVVAEGSHVVAGRVLRRGCRLEGCQVVLTDHPEQRDGVAALAGPLDGGELRLVQDVACRSDQVELVCDHMATPDAGHVDRAGDRLPP